jgi:2-dehydropantoate 2-reductase
VSNAAEKPIVVAGAGSIGCFVGGLLAAAGRNVTLLARRRVIEEIHANGLHLTSLEGGDWRVAAPAIGLMEAPAAMAGAKIVLVTVKSLDTAAMADLIAAHAPADAVIVSLQNGVDNVPLLRERLPGRRVLAGMVPFNVVSMGGGHVHRATSGDIVLERDDADTAAQLSVPGLAIIPSDRMTDVQWGKLLFNLNNAINALSNLPLREQLSQRPWRRILAAQMAEALAAMKAAGIVPHTSTPLPAALLPFVLRLPDGIFRAVAAQMLRIDPQARSSMWEDLQQGRRTEVDHLQGAIIRLASRHGLQAPLSERIVALVKAAEGMPKGSPGLNPERIMPAR